MEELTDVREEAAQLAEMGYSLTEDALRAIRQRLALFDPGAFRPYLRCGECPTILDKLAFPPRGRPLVQSVYDTPHPDDRKATTGSQKVRRTIEGQKWQPLSYEYLKRPGFHRGSAV